MQCLKSAKWLALFSLGTTSCDVHQPSVSENGRFFYANESSDNYSFLLDDKPAVIPKYTVGSVMLKPGLHSMTINGGKVIYFMVYPGNKGGILNPQRNFYYTYNFIYGNNGISSIYHLTVQELVVGDYLLKGRLHSSNSYVIDNNVFNCDYPIGTKIPENLDSSTTVSKVKTKCFSREELIKNLTEGEIFISQMLARKGVFSRDESATLSFEYPLNRPDFRDENIQHYADNMMEIVKVYRESTNPSQKQDFYNQYHTIVLKMVEIYDKWGSDGVCVEEKQKYEDFMVQTRAIFSAGTLIQQ